jgi:hypothetical protein
LLSLPRKCADGSPRDVRFALRLPVRRSGRGVSDVRFWPKAVIHYRGRFRHKPIGHVSCCPCLPIATTEALDPGRTCRPSGWAGTP